jgi:hypothetical protein
MTDSIYLASTYRMKAVIFWESAKTLDEKMEKKKDGSPAKALCIPYYFLVSHAIELFLKSALLKRGWNENDLKAFDYRHNLNKLLEEILKIGLIVSPESKSLVNNLSEQHSTHSLRYNALIDDGKKTFIPPPRLVDPVLEELLMLTRISTQGI